jgi:hypothetical protein
MPDFSARFIDGVSLETWEDPATVSPARPSRTNPAPQRPARYWLGTVGTPIEVQATVDGVEGEVDANLGGRTFISWFAECPSPRAPIAHPPGSSSVSTFTPRQPGHYTLVLRRKEGGGIFLHVDVAEAP